MISEILGGFKTYTDAWKFSKEHNLWKYFVIPSIISLVLGVSVFYFAYLTGNYFFDQIDVWLHSEFFDRWSWVQKGLQYFGSLLGGLMIFLPAMFVFKYLVIIVNGPFMAPLSEKVEEIIYGQVSNQNSGISGFGYSIVRSLRFNLTLILKELFFTLLFTLLLLPVSIVSPFVIFLIQSYYAGRGNMDYAMERSLNVKEGLSFSKSNKGLAIANGVPFVLLLYIPIIGFILAPPLSTIAVTIKTLERLRETEKNNS